MILGTIFAVAVLAVVLLTFGLSRTDFLRKPSFEGIEDFESAQAYDRISRWPQFRLLRRMIARKLAKYQPAGTLADIGCGPGRLTTLIARRHRHLRLLGLDAAEEMIRTATLNASSLGLSGRVQFRQGDVRSLPLPADTLDFAISTLSLHHWSDPGRGLAEIHRVLKTGGAAFLIRPEEGSSPFLLLAAEVRTSGRSARRASAHQRAAGFAPVQLHSGRASSAFGPVSIQGIQDRGACRMGIRLGRQGPIRGVPTNR